MRIQGKFILFLFMSYLGLGASQSAWSQTSPARSAAVFDHSHSHWTAFLQKHVTVRGKASTVNYKSVKKDPIELNVYLKSIQLITKDQFDTFSQSEKLAFLINAYNAFTVKLIVDHYPVDSIKDIGSLLTSAWKIKFFTLFGAEKHLDNIEHDMIRKWFNEPRIHFAVVCASVGCPALRNEAYVADRIESQLEDAAINFLSDHSRNRYFPAQQSLELSSIFKWYGGDFVKKFGSVENFIASRITSNPTDQAVIREKKVSISYLDYDWSLNEEN